MELDQEKIIAIVRETYSEEFFTNEELKTIVADFVTDFTNHPSESFAASIVNALDIQAINFYNDQEENSEESGQEDRKE